VAADRGAAQEVQLAIASQPAQSTIDGLDAGARLVEVAPLFHGQVNQNHVT
jgi:hypothetical protein